MARLLAASLLLHAIIGVVLWRLEVPAHAAVRAPIEITVGSTPAPSVAPKESAPPAPVAPAPKRALAMAPSPRRAPNPTPNPSPTPTPNPNPNPNPTPNPNPNPNPNPTPTPNPTAPAAEPTVPPPRVNLFPSTTVTKAAGIDLSGPTVDRGFQPRRGVGGDSRSGGTDVASFLAEDAARMRVNKGAIGPELRRLERRLQDAFQPTFNQADNSNRAELFIKQFRGFLKNPPKTGELARTIDPTKETLAEKLRSMRPDQAFFLGRRIEIFVRQAPDGTIREIAIRNASGYKAFDEMALAAVEKALNGKLPAGANNDRDVRTLWQLDATAYVVISPQPELVFDESTGKGEWVYPLQKRVDKAVSLIAVY